MKLKKGHYYITIFKNIQCSNPNRFIFCVKEVNNTRAKIYVISDEADGDEWACW